MPFAPYSAGQRLTADAMNLVSMNGAVIFRARNTVGTTITSAVETPIPWDTIELDLLSGWSAGNPSRYTATIAGWYRCSGSIAWGTGTSGDRDSLYFINGVAQSGSRTRLTFSVANSTPVRTISFLLGVGDYVELAAKPTGSNVSLNTGSLSPDLSITFSGTP